ncbi:Transcription factor [Penicillium macrosclerotiorum]|uniref:Transcription factor n=1 Tax=Penicillium macrosclerotiorum TaxID=303699 RepID=UPI0025485615|nr:Transcription factor [Penicillium macrosclerotiorum]KAJ5674207.1 Transcription factor [Penicillium macrosclerotiorum]
MIKRLESIEEQISCLKADLLQSHVKNVGTAAAHASPESTASFSLRDKPSVPAKSSGKHFVEDATGATIFLGSHSDIPAALGCRQASRDAPMPDAFVLDQLVPRTYPFTSLWGPEAGAGEVSMTLPDDSDIIRYWQVYKNCAYPFYPGLVTIEQFETSLFKFLDRRAELDRSNELSSLDEIDSSWLALLFAVLAGGVQFSEDPIKERDLRSKVFVCSSFQCLRISNFFNNTNLNQIQAMALIGHCLRNNLDTNSAWILMGATMRLAQSIGLHEEAVLPESSSSVIDRWMLLWQDTFLSFTYDRPPSTINHSSTIPHRADSGPEKSFAECIFTLCQVLLDRARNYDTEIVSSTLTYKRRVEAVWDDAAPFLRSKSRCRTLQDHLEYLGLRIHVNYGICRLCRLILDTTSTTNPTLVDLDSLQKDCCNRATEAIESFLDMHRLSATVCRSWAFVHNAVSCAFTLQNIDARASEAHSAELVKRLVTVLGHEERMSSWQDADTNIRSFGPYSRALKALKESISNGSSDMY